MSIPRITPSTRPPMRLIAGDRAARPRRRRGRTCWRRPSRRRSRPRARGPSGAGAPDPRLMAPDDRSASIAICLPGIASRVKRAATSATRPAPLVTTTKLMTVRMRKTTRPTRTLPSTTKRPNASTTEPAEPCPSPPWSRMRRVVATLRLRRSSVAMSTNAGKRAELQRLLDEERREEDADGKRDGEAR